MTGTLFLIPNTLGPTESLDQVIPQHVQQLTAQLAHFVAENAKTARAFLKQVGTSKPIQEIAINELNINTPPAALADLLAPLQAGHDVGLLSEAGVPAVADPGADLVRLAHAHGIPVRPLVGPSSILMSVMASGLSGQSFAFNGYLPTDAAQRAKRLKDLETRSRQEKQTQLFIETPYRNAAMLEALVSTCAGSTLICVATDISLPTEAIRTQTGAQWKSQLTAGKAPDFHKKPTVFLLLAQ
ncbi:SAM-dependent methyltransferase [Pseudoduganella sp. DS3]|uniref:SAM-dependent methyltransferase n=1 Tax=Pseudoduganella guangdongensis TaxID=2692179 RepID=A0A6N9HI45_9BURK|nr:SAM-dependent methyltransferase [Pseudoduganella guangdongensis]MYN03160.1 SAM-dependent methyltransferase [Pseudoduganella guangdongensis]